MIYTFEIAKLLTKKAVNRAKDQIDVLALEQIQQLRDKK